MIREVQGAIEAYNGLDKLGKRLFRDETGLVSAQGIKPKRRRVRKPVTETVAEEVQEAPVPKRKRAALAAPADATIPTGGILPAAE